MFKKSDEHKQLDAFSSPIEYLKDSTMNYYLKNDSWHNQFRKQVVMRVDESTFSVLYTQIIGAPRYFNMESVRAATLRQKLKDIPIQETNIRNNVEATIFQLGYHYSNTKSRYRGLAKHKLWAYSRSLWINFVRIMKYVTQL